MIDDLLLDVVNVPNGFAVTASAYWHFLQKAGIKDQIQGWDWRWKGCG